MTSEKELEIEGGKLSYSIQDGEVTVVSCCVSGSRVVIPDTIDGMQITKLDRKAFLSSKPLREICLPAGLKEIGDWAFAYCSNLKRVVLPKKDISPNRHQPTHTNLPRYSLPVAPNRNRCLQKYQ